MEEGTLFRARRRFEPSIYRDVTADPSMFVVDPSMFITGTSILAADPSMFITDSSILAADSSILPPLIRRCLPLVPRFLLLVLRLTCS